PGRIARQALTSPEEADEWPSADDKLLALATPLWRDEALRRLGDELDTAARPSLVEVERRIEIRKLLREPRAVARIAVAHGQLERGAELAEEAGDHSLAARGWYAAGEFARASRAVQSLQDR